MDDRCQVCRGEQKIRLPLYRPVVASFEATAVKIDETYRTYPCPECSPKVATDKIRVLEHHFQADTRFEGQEGYREHLVRSGVVAIANQIERGGFMRIQSAPADRAEMRRGYRITVGVASIADVSNLDADRFAHEDAYADLVVKIAAAEIQNWGSYYGHSEILKRDATRLLGDALRKAKDTRPKAVC